jgi:glucosamine 6-phosphate synthetase-like amidotransferase/phosphosugar isomerase protein
MCGIVGYVGKDKQCVEVLMEGLRNLEYRGYDSAGLTVALPEAGHRDHQGGGTPRQPSGHHQQEERRLLQGARRGRPHAVGDPRAPQRGQRPSTHGAGR